MGIRLHNLAVLGVVVAVRLLDVVKDRKAVLEFFVQHHVVDGFLHLLNHVFELLLLLVRDVVVVVSAASQRDLEVLLRLLEALLVRVQFGRELLEKSNDLRANVLHPVVLLLQIEHRVCDQGFGLKFASSHCRFNSARHDTLECLAWLELGVVFDKEIFEVKFSDVDVLVCVFHVFCKLVDQAVENDLGFIVELAQFLFLLVNKGGCQLGGPAIIQLADDFDAMLVQRLLLLPDSFEDFDSRLGIHELWSVHFIQETLDRIFMFQFVEPHHSLFPRFVVFLELVSIFSNNLFVKCLELFVLFFVLDEVLLAELNHQLIDCRLQFKRNKDKSVFQFVKRGGGSFALPGFQIVEGQSQVI